MLKKRLSIGFAAVLPISMMSISSPVNVNATVTKCSHHWIFSHDHGTTFEKSKHTFTCKTHHKKESCTIEREYCERIYFCNICDSTKAVKELVHSNHLKSDCPQY